MENSEREKQDRLNISYIQLGVEQERKRIIDWLRSCGNDDIADRLEKRPKTN